MNIPNNWEHKSGYHLNADGKAIVYIHKNKEIEAIVECMYVNEDKSPNIQYYTVIFDENKKEPLEYHEFHSDKNNAKEHLKSLMKKHN